MIGTSLVALISFSSLSVSVAVTAAADDLVEYGMSLAEFDDIRMSESEADFDGVGDLWDEALLFEYKIAMSYAEDKALTSLGYHPYVVCNYAPDKTGSSRTEMVKEVFQNTTGVDASHFFFEGISQLNDDEHSCGLIRAFNDTIPKVYASNPYAQTWMKTNPIHPSMKMIDGTVAIIQARMDGDYDLGMIVIDDNNDNWYIKRSTLEFSNVLCPGVRDFNGAQIVSGEDISQAAKAFVIEDGGKTVRDASFYYDKVNNGGNNEYTQRMKLWSDAVSFVVNLTKTDGRNPCLDTVIGKTFTFEVSPYIGQGGTGVLEVYSSVSEEEGYAIAEASNMTKEDVDQCIWYTLYAIALNPMVCSVEPKARPQTLCPDLTSDLSQCPPPSPPPSQPSSGHVVPVSFMNIATVSMVIAILLSSCV